MNLPIYQVDAFTSNLFGGNPAAVIPLDYWLDHNLMQAIASENNLSETAYFVPEGEGFRIRWFTPATEVDLCGHATLATAHVLFDHLNYGKSEILFQSKSGILKVIKAGDLLELDFPATELSRESVPEDILAGFNYKPIEKYKANEDFLLVFENESQISQLDPDFAALKKVKSRGIICTAISEDPEIDFVSRFFAPAAGINEDPVTGSAHTKLIPYWSKKLNKTEMIARQISARGGELFCKLDDDRVKIGGKAVSYLHGEIIIP